MRLDEEVTNAPWPELIRRARESGPQFIVRYLQMLRRHRQPPELIRRYQERRLERILRHALVRVPAYRLWSDAITVPLQRDGCRVLTSFPRMDRSSLADRWQQYVSANAQRYSPKLVQTGGTRGRPVQLYLDGRVRAIWNMMRLLRLQWAGWRPGDRSVFFRMANSHLPGSIAADTPYVLNPSRTELTLNGGRLDNATLHEFARLVIDFRPNFVWGYPSLLQLLAKTIERQPCRVRVKAVMTGGELIGQERRSYLEGIFECKVFDWYNMWENVATAVQCERGSYHLIPELSYVEILRNGHQCNPGEAGDIVGTHLANYCMPLIRYNMDDLAVPQAGVCSCGRTTPTISLVGGRGRDLIVTSKGFVPLQAGFVFARLGPAMPIKKLQFYQERQDEVVVRIVRDEMYAEDDARRLLGEIGRLFDGNVKLHLDYVNDIPRSPSGKHIFVISHVPLEL